jgi:hypothetical protein
MLAIQESQYPISFSFDYTSTFRNAHHHHSGAHAASVFVSTMGDRNHARSLPIGPRRPEFYGVTSVRMHVWFQMTYLSEALVEEHVGKISFGHVYPGLVGGLIFLAIRMLLAREGNDKEKVNYAKLKWKDFHVSCSSSLANCRKVTLLFNSVYVANPAKIFMDLVSILDRAVLTS